VPEADALRPLLDPWVQESNLDGASGETLHSNMPETTDQPDKATLRRLLRERRGSIGARQRLAAGRALVKLALRHHLLAKGRRIGLYMPARNEIDVLPLIQRSLMMQAPCFLPIVPRLGRKRMWFSQLGSRPGWTLNRYGIPEYLHPSAPRVRAHRLDLLFMPMLGFDDRGYRLGMGGGYYDASLAYLSRTRHWRRPWVVGVAYSVQEVERVGYDAWDIPLDAVLTERKYRIFRPVHNR
jgi:5-formyltetrahydrofolate cyclo-ligase